MVIQRSTFIHVFIQCLPVFEGCSTEAGGIWLFATAAVRQRCKLPSRPTTSLLDSHLQDRDRGRAALGGLRGEQGVHAAVVLPAL